MKYIVTYNQPFSYEVHYANTIDEAKKIIEEIFTDVERKDIRVFKVEEEICIAHLFDKTVPSSNKCQ
ncbi:hypothetical protein ACQCVE_14695 [Metabacillus sp. 113a]|uniref:hypothetical protein n=1 Tax=Metabacillus sp. 113a TaxID=3404706 RepID=UPI003CF7C635